MKKSLKSFLVLFLAILFIFPAQVGVNALTNDTPSGWAKDSVNNAITLGLVPKYLQQYYRYGIARVDFSNLIYSVMKLADNDEFDKTFPRPANWKDVLTDTPEYDWLAELIYNGVVSKKGEKTFDPNGGIVREEAAVWLYNAAKLLNIPVNLKGKAFADAAKISKSAESAVDFVYSSGLMEETGKDMFAPKDTYTLEQAILSVLRLYNAYDLIRSRIHSLKELEDFTGEKYDSDSADTTEYIKSEKCSAIIFPEDSNQSENSMWTLGVALTEASDSKLNFTKGEEADIVFTYSITTPFAGTYGLRNVRAYGWKMVLTAYEVSTGNRIAEVTIKEMPGNNIWVYDNQMTYYVSAPDIKSEKSFIEFVNKLVK